MKKLAMSLCGSAFALLSGCGAPEVTTPELVVPADPAVAALTESCATGNSLHPQYRAKNGPLLEGMSGTSFTVQSARKDCSRVDGLALDKSTITGSVDGISVSGKALAGAVLTVADSQGTTALVAVTNVDVEVDAQDPKIETSLYTLVTLDASKNAVKNVCLPDADGRSVAIALSGRWDETGAHIADGSISFHCTSGAIAKCVRLGYRPWLSYKDKSLADYHQACTRMVRGDYCGTGTAQTKEGTEIDFYDNMSLRVLEPSLLLTYEASWSKQGAYCISRERWLSLSTLLTPACKGQFSLLIQPSPILQSDLCFAVRIGAQSSDALISNRTSINLGL